MNASAAPNPTPMKPAISPICSVMRRPGDGHREHVAALAVAAERQLARRRLERRYRDRPIRFEIDEEATDDQEEREHEQHRQADRQRRVPPHVAA